MRTRVDLTRHLLDFSYRMMADNLKGLTLQEALFVPPGGYRSILGTLKHAAAWSHIYHSYAFDPKPRHWRQTDWPHGLRDTVIKSQEYLDDVTARSDRAHHQWMQALSTATDEQLDQLRPLHWGGPVPLYDIVVVIANHHSYHAGELNQVLSIYRGEA